MKGAGLSGLAGVTVSLSSASTVTISTSTDASGNFSFTGLASGLYTLTPSKSGYMFTPTNDVKSVSAFQSTNMCGFGAMALIQWTMLKLPGTGQTTHYSTAFGDDANYTRNPPSFTDNGNGTITDNVTTLMWQKLDDGTIRIWYDAGTYCTGLSLGGHEDWRLPNVIELMSIVDFGKFNPAINTTYFTNTKSMAYWSSSLDAYNYSQTAFVVHFNHGSTSRNYPDLASNPCYVRCVRGGI